MLAAALSEIEARAFGIEAVSQIMPTAPLGPSRRRYANAAAIVGTDLAPPACLVQLQEVERRFGRERRGQRWRPRVLDLDIVAWSGGPWSGEQLVIPHPEFRGRAFVVGPAAAIASAWRDPITGLTLAQLHARLTRTTPLP
ncbi:2-amino-4-hydroxy-6-hydroxymethyldihydropteridine diphosphokinase [Tsuneonella sp. HG249]